jgi:quinol monooxygenase YgiN
MKNEILTVVAKVEAQEEYIELIKNECLALLAPSRREKGCLHYNLYQAKENPAIFMFYETWQSREDLDNHLDSPHCTRFDNTTSGKLAKPEEIILLSRLEH